MASLGLSGKITRISKLLSHFISFLKNADNNFRFLVAYFIVPETENRALEDIELHFFNNSRGLTDINIRVGREQPADFPRMPNSSI